MQEVYISIVNLLASIQDKLVQGYSWMVMQVKSVSSAW